ncbi:matrix-remodeling-associated protein 7 isoform X2 [Xiphophorus hellerii]|uniref:matrix-remodeling-associated protein 7 isoform X2 n=1 Tax=Xiphophorus hellerii TaxID=8084 RepID=UPI0013B42DCD|nr:matrix-remodeling-associated protein 7 isoform X2 [Xiphophorus hellerii]
MEATLALAAIIFTLLAMVVATSLLKGSSPAADFANARSYFGQRGDGGSATSEAKLNGHVAGQERKKDADNWSEISGSSHDHWDVVKSEQGHPHFDAEGGAAVESSSSTSSLSVPSLEVDSSSEVSSAMGRRSFIGLSDTELLKCAFSYPQTEGATESPGDNTCTLVFCLNSESGIGCKQFLEICSWKGTIAPFRGDDVQRRVGRGAEGAAGAAGRHFPAAERQQGDVRGRV